MISRDTFSVRVLNPNTGVLIHSRNIKNYIDLSLLSKYGDIYKNQEYCPWIITFITSCKESLFGKQTTKQIKIHSCICTTKSSKME